MIRTLLVASLLIFVGLAGVPAIAAEIPEGEKPQLVLVSVGRGARGAAHIGVIRVLEELHIAPDLVVGTSMGSIIGGLYAAGWSADDMEELVQEIDWETGLHRQGGRGDRILPSQAGRPPDHDTGPPPF